MFNDKKYYLAALSIAMLLLSGADAGAKSFLDSLDEAVNSIDRSVNDLNRSIDRIGGDVNKALDGVNAAVNQTVKAAEAGAKKASQPDANAITARGVTVTNSGVNRDSSVTTTVNGVGNTVTRISNDTVVIVENGKKTVHKLGNESVSSAADGISKTVSGISNQVNTAVNQAGRAIDKMSGDLDRIFGDINKSVSGAGKRIEETAGGVKTTTRTTVDNAGRVITETTNSVNSGVTRVFNNEQVVTVTNGQSRNIGGRINEIIGSVNNAINPMANPNANQPVNTPVNRINPNAVSGDPETKYSEKALEGMALLGDRWAKLKLDELRAKKMADMLYTKYKSISWLNVFKKLDAYSDYKNAKNYYVMTAEQVRQYEIANPNSGGIVQGIDQINESVLEFKALFGDKKAQAQLEVLRAKREYDRIKLQYDSAGLFEKLKYRGELKYAEARYQEALKALETVDRGGAFVSRDGSNPGVTVVDNAADLRGNTYNNTNTVTNINSGATTYTNNNNVIYGDANGTTVVYDNVVLDKNGRVTSSSGTRIYNNTEALNVAKSRMDAAYKAYIDCMSETNPSQSKLSRLQKEYYDAVEAFQNIAHGNGR